MEIACFFFSFQVARTDNNHTTDSVERRITDVWKTSAHFFKSNLYLTSLTLFIFDCSNLIITNTSHFLFWMHWNCHYWSWFNSIINEEDACITNYTYVTSTLKGCFFRNTSITFLPQWHSTFSCFYGNVLINLNGIYYDWIQ